MEVSIQRANEADFDWVNKQYASMGFKLSRPDSEEIFILKEDDEKAAIGRLVKISAESFELGGIFVMPKFRGRKYAEMIVGRLLEASNDQATIYCLPFAKLGSFYRRLGFRDLQEEEFLAVPREILSKLQWCKETYEDQTLLLVQ